MNSRGLASAWRRAVVAVVLGLVGAGLWGCGKNGSPYADVPRLEVAWTASLGQSALSFTEQWATEELWIVFDSKSHQLFARRLVDGSAAWTLPSLEPCGLSEVNAEGLLAVRSGTRPNCGRVGVIDTTTGEELWSTDVGVDESSFAEAGQIGLSAQTVSAVGACGVERWEAGSGKKLEPVRGSQRDPDLLGRCRAALTSSNIAVVVGANELVGYDVDTGEKRWTREGKEADIGSLHSTDPLLAEIAMDGVAGLRTLDPASGEIGPIIGRPKGRHMSPGPVEVVGDRVVGSYQRLARQRPNGTYESAVRAWDPDSGEELGSWPGQEREDYLGVGDDGVYMGREVSDGRSELGTVYWVTRADWSGNPARTVGWIEDDHVSPVAVAGDLVIDSGYGELADGSQGHRVVAYKLPEKSTADPIPHPKHTGKLKWAKEDVRPDPRVDPCAEVSEDTWRGLGFASMLDREAPLDCEWTKGSATVSTQVEVHSPDSNGSAVAKAQEAAATARGWMKSPVAVDGLGDEAWAGMSTYVAEGPDEEFQLGDPAQTSTGIRVVVRQQNVVAYVAISDWADPREGRLPPAALTREASVVAALKDVVGAAGVDLTVPSAVSDGPITQLPDMCDAIAADVRKVLPGAKATDLATKGDERLRGCLWATRRDGYLDSHVQVVAYAVGASPITGVTGSEAAEKIFADSRGKLATSRDDRKWDQSVMADDFSGGYRDASHFSGRSDNVILVVDINLRDRDRPVASTVAPRIADRAMQAIRR